jgi:hypothetical protein
MSPLSIVYTDREIQHERVGLQVEKERCGDLLFQSEGFNQQLEDDFNLIVHKLDKANTTEAACLRKVEQQELSLYALLPLSTETFQRLFKALQTQSHEQDFNTLLALLHPEAVEQFKQAQEQARLIDSQNTKPYLPTPPPSQSIPLETKLRELALLCPLSFTLRKLNIPSPPYLALQTQSPQSVSIQNGSTIIRQWTKEEILQNRQKTMQQVIDCTNTLVDLAIQLLEFAETSLPDFQPPPFHLGPLPAPPQEPLAAFEIVNPIEETIKQEIRDQLELRRQLRQAQGREDEPLQIFELEVIAHSLTLSLRTGDTFRAHHIRDLLRQYFPDVRIANFSSEPLMRVGT